MINNESPISKTVQGGGIKVRKLKGISRGSTTLALLALFALALTQLGCGETDSSSVPTGASQPTTTLTLIATGPRGETSTANNENSIIIPANGRDLMSLVAQVTGIDQ